MARRSPAFDDAILRLDRWQVTGALLGLGAIIAVVFFAGVVVGRQSSAPLPPTPARIGSSDGDGGGATTMSHAERSRAMAELKQGTREIDSDLARPIADVVPRDPTDAARVETHRQLQESRSAGLAGVEGASAAPTNGPHVVSIAPSAGIASSSDGRTGYTLQVSAFEVKAAATAVTGELEAGGYPARMREVSANGRTFWRVEVGFFESPAAASGYQGQFERKSGYKTVMVPVI
ncbi:MAG: hypothetical protein CVU56_08350 [Deltaproteobacteria bacterium HGW-Deltaproteobacteria-14]|jgi:septal ring-binding cell division protein DamX|nr:MAG: hypothetical protein CVU56_08350 [Deltaproteobacteria bacterium HGW-Deltaproteobacteria-14]